MDNKPQKDNSRQILAFVLIGIGSLLLLRKIGLYLNFPTFYFHQVFAPVRKIFHSIGDFIFSWQLVFIVIGLILLAGKRSVGLVFLIIGTLFLLPKIVFFPGFTFSMVFPVVLVAIGVAIVARKI